MLVSCICPTMRVRESDWLPKAIASFIVQTWPDKEMVIVSDAPRSVPPDERIRWVRFIGDLGMKRNVACSAARGSTIVHFDDDDYSSSRRIADQVRTLDVFGAQVAGYHTLTYRELRPVYVHDANGRHPTTGWWKWASADGAAAGTSLCYRRDWWSAHRFQDVRLGEDDLFWREAVRAGEAVATDGSEFLCATNHDGCCSGRAIGGHEWQELAATGIAANG